MNSRERFLETMRFGQPDRVPYFQEGLRPDVLQAWGRQGLQSADELSSLFPIDGRVEEEIDGHPHPRYLRWPRSAAGLNGFRRRLKPGDARLPSGWRKHAPAWRNRQDALMLEVHHGFFLTMGVNDWQQFNWGIESLIDRPELVLEFMRIEARMVAATAERFLSEVQIDAAIFSEPIGGNNGALISPRMYEQFVLSTYAPIVEVLKLHGVDVIILRTYANARVLIPSMLKFGLNCLWACETNAEAMDYRSLRREFGKDLRLIGGIDLDVLRQDTQAIRREVEEKVPPLLAKGRYFPNGDHGIQPPVTFSNLCKFMCTLHKVCTNPEGEFPRG